MRADPGTRGLALAWLTLALSNGCSADAGTPRRVRPLPAAEQPAERGQAEKNAADASASGHDSAAARRLTALASGVVQIDIAEPESYWRRAGFRPLAPVVRVSVPSPSLEVAIFLRLPAAGAISVAPAADGMLRLVWPPGSEADRVSYGRRTDGKRVVRDVRGSRIDASSAEHFHVYRPKSGARNAALRGYEWKRDDRAQRQQAHALLMDLVLRTPRGVNGRLPSAEYVGHFSRLMNCEACHFANKSPAEDKYGWLPPWPTDSIGWYVPQSVMRTAAELSTSADFHDPNYTDVFVSAQCPGGEAQLHERGPRRWFSCPAGAVVMGKRDLRAALAANHAYSRSVCESRKWLLSRMTAAARTHFAALARECEK